ncbi:L-threonylcarbamoyladenylate synthase [Francisellaceae bacterium CB300]
MITTSINTILKSLANNEIVSIPTDTVYGLSCNINKFAVNKLISLKQRDSSKGFIIISHSVEHLLNYIDTASLTAEQIEKIKTPQSQPTTWIVPAIKNIQWLTGSKLTIAIRLAQTTEITAICSHLDNAIISTSANLSGQTFINNALHISKVFDDIIVFDNKRETKTTPSTILNISTGKKIR